MAQPMIFPCPRCGATHQLTAEYLAQYGGQTTTCTSCGSALVLPTTAVLEALPAGPPSPVLPYSSAQVVPTTYGGVWREGNLLVVAKGSSLPPCCVKCNELLSSVMKRKTFYWHHPAIYVAVISPVIYIILALALRKSGTIQFGLCEKHRKRRMRGIWGGLGFVALSIVVFVISAQTHTPELIPVGIVIILGGLIWAALAARTLTPNRIDERFLWLKGACAVMLDSIPNSPTWGAPGANQQPMYGQYPPR